MSTSKLYRPKHRREQLGEIPPKVLAAFRVKGGCPTCKPVPAPVRVTPPVFN